MTSTQAEQLQVIYDSVIGTNINNDMTVVISFTSNANGTAGYSTVKKGENVLQSFGFAYNDTIALGLLKLTYNGSQGIITAIHNCIVNEEKYDGGDHVATMTGYTTFKNYEFIIKL